MPTSESLLLDPDFVRDPHAGLERLREEEPVYYDPHLGWWFVTRYDDVKRMLADPGLSKSRSVFDDYVAPEPGSFAGRFDSASVLHKNPENHRVWRKRVAAGFTPRAVRRMERQVREVVEQFAAPIREATGRVDLLAAFADPIPNTVIARIAGVPPFPGDESRFRALAQDVLRRYVFFADEENLRRGDAALEELAEWILKLTGDRRQERSEDLVSDLIHEETEHPPLSDDEIMVFVASLISAGSETTTLGACHMFRHLFDHPDQFALVRKDPSLIPNAVREALRYDFGSLAAVTPRYATEDFEIHGKTIRRGDSIMLSPASANRDSSVFEDPHRFDVTRDAREALTFGNGPHYCLGANLAMQELSFMLEAALTFLSADAVLKSSEDDWEQVGIMRRPLRMIVDLRR